MSPVTSSATDNDSLLRGGIDRSLRHPVMFFFTSSAAWFAVSVLLGLLSSAKIHNPGLLADCSWLTYGRVQQAHMATLVYGAAMQAAFAVGIWLMSRLARKECPAPGIILAAGHVWGLAVTAGTIGIFCGYGTGMAWMEFPSFVWPVLLLSYIAIFVWSVIQFRVRPEGHDSIPQWFLLAAMLWFPWIFVTANVLVHCVPGHPLMASGVNAWFRSGMVFLFLVPMALGAAYYLAPKLTGKPVPSLALAKLGFWTLVVLGPWAGLQKLAGAPIPYFLPYAGACATALMLVPILCGVANTLGLLFSEPKALFVSPTMRFTSAGLIAGTVLALLAAVLNLPNSTLRLTQFTFSGYGFDMVALVGFFSFVMVGAAYFIVPRVIGREWLSRRMIRTHFTFAVLGALMMAAVAFFGGLELGLAQERWDMPWMAAAESAYPHATLITFAWVLILFSSVFFFLHLGVMWLRLGRRSTQPTLLVASRKPVSGAGGTTEAPVH